MEFWGSTLGGKCSNASKKQRQTLWTQSQEHFHNLESRNQCLAWEFIRWEEIFKYLLQILLSGSYKLIFLWSQWIILQDACLQLRRKQDLSITWTPFQEWPRRRFREKHNSPRTELSQGCHSHGEGPGEKLCWPSGAPWFLKLLGFGIHNLGFTGNKGIPKIFPFSAPHQSCPCWQLKIPSAAWVHWISTLDVSCRDKTSPHYPAQTQVLLWRQYLIGF